MGGFGCCDAGVVAEGEVVADGVLSKGPVGREDTIAEVRG